MPKKPIILHDNAAYEICDGCHRLAVYFFCLDPAYTQSKNNYCANAPFKDVSANQNINIWLGLRDS
jgi:hypothetical protein